MCQPAESAGWCCWAIRCIITGIHPGEDRPLRQRIREIAHSRVRYGFWRIFILLRREGFMDNHKRVYRVYKEEGLNLRSKRPRRSRSAAHRLERLDTPAINRIWSMDFVQDALFNGSRFRILAVVDNYSKKCLSLLTGKSLKGEDERDEVKPSIDVVIRMADALEVSLDFLVGKTNVQIDEQTRRRLAEIEKLPAADKEHILYAIDNLIKAAKINAL